MNYYMEVYNGKSWEIVVGQPTGAAFVAHLVKTYVSSGVHARMVNGDDVLVDPNDYDGTNATARLTDEYQLGFTAGWDAALKWAYPA